tara:strand:+ start:5888 stop:7219 length:1332 start_codon:yes stop_codon:yes gene_type:complete
MTDTFDYTPADLRTPRGNNGLSPQANYYQRSLYNEAIYPQSSPRPLDTWYGKIYYGKIDRNQTLVIPRESLLVPLPSSILAAPRANPVVADLFRQFVAHMNHAMVVGALDPEGNAQLYDLQVHAAYQAPGVQYQAYLERLYGAFVDSFSDFGKNAIHDFPTYLNVLMPYLKQVAAYAPITQSGFMCTPLATRFTSGLSVAIAQGNPEDDASKYENFVNDPNFRFYSKAAKKFGFMVEKNMPWVLTADLFTDAFLAGLNNFYTPEYEIMQEDNFFPTFFTPTAHNDIMELILFMVNSYNLFVRQNPLRDIVTLCESGKTRVQLAERTALPEGPAGATATADILTDKQMINFYIDVRHIETKEPFKVSGQLRRDAEDAYRLMVGSRTDKLAAAAAIVDTAFRPYLYDPSYFTYANLNSINFMLTGVDTAAKSANITTTTTSNSSY